MFFLTQLHLFPAMVIMMLIAIALKRLLRFSRQIVLHLHGRYVELYEFS